MKIGFNTIPPECQCCGAIDNPDGGNPVESYDDNNTNPRWPNWLCAECRFEQWHTEPDGGDDIPAHQFLGWSWLEYKYWAETKWDKFKEARTERLAQ